MKSRVSILAAPIFAIVSLGAGCGSNGAGQTDEWTGSSDSQLVCTGAGIHPASCGGFTPPPPPPAPLITRTPTLLAAPFAGCTAPEYLVASVRATGVVTYDYFYALCPTGAASTAWVAANPSLLARTATSIESAGGWVYAPTGQTYVEFNPPTPTTLPTENDATPPVAYNTDTPPVAFNPSNIPVDDANPVPCTDMFFSVPSFTPELNGVPLTRYSWVGYCVDTPAVDALAAQLAAQNVTNGTGNVINADFGEGATGGPADMPAAPYGYVYIYGFMDKHHASIGGGCKSGCFFN